MIEQEFDNDLRPGGGEIGGRDLAGAIVLRFLFSHDFDSERQQAYKRNAILKRLRSRVGGEPAFLTALCNVESSLDRIHRSFCA